MPETLAFRFDPSQSRRARLVRAAAVALTTVAAAACLAAALAGPSATRVAAALAAAAALAWATYGGRRSAPVLIRIGADGRLRLRAVDGGVDRPTEALYCGPRLIVLRGTTESPLAVWPDALPAAAWRRLLVACRWPQGPGPTSRAGGQAN